MQFQLEPQKCSVKSAKIIQDILEEGVGFGLLEIKTYDRATVMKKVWYWGRDRHIGQWTRQVQKEIPQHSHLRYIWSQ